MSCLIYKITNMITNKVYIGQTWKTLEERWEQHQKLDSCIKLYNSIQFHGANKFKLEILSTVESQEIANDLEKHFIKYYDAIKNGYNIREGGAGGKFKLTDEQKQKISKALKGRKFSVSHIAKLKNRVMSKETKSKISEARLGKHNSINTEFKKGVSIPKTKKHKEAIGKANQKLTAEQRLAIQNDDRTLEIIAKSYEVSKNTIWRIKNKIQRCDQ
jgi:group I intron endonuclease